VLRPGGNERRATFVKLQVLSSDVEHPSSFEHDVDLVVCVRASTVGLRCDERVDTDVKAPRLVDGLVPTVRSAEPRFRFGDIERAGHVRRAALPFASIPTHTWRGAHPRLLSQSHAYQDEPRGPVLVSGPAPISRPAGAQETIATLLSIA